MRQISLLSSGSPWKETSLWATERNEIASYNNARENSARKQIWPLLCKKAQAAGSGAMLAYLLLRTGFCHADPIRDGAPIRVVLRFKLAAARVKGVAPTFGRQRLHQQFALTRIPASHY